MPSNTSPKTPDQKVPSNMKLRPLPTPLVIACAPSPSKKTTTVDEVNSFPCRRCLQDGNVGETMTLLPYDPWLGDSPYRQQGPIFVHSTPECEPYKADGLVPDQLHRRMLSVRSFGPDHCMVSGEVVKGDRLMEVSAKMMENDLVDYIHVHNAIPGCFAVRIDRV